VSILSVGINESKKWGEIQAKAESLGVKMPIFDGLIAAIGLFHNMAIVTRHITDLEASGVAMINPWQ
jgi:predicted nucleic acid-binding protein